MASVEAKDIPVMQQFMQPFWTCIKKFYKTESNDEYWNEMCAYIDELGKKFDHKLAKKLLIAYADYLEEEHKKGDGL